MGMREIKFRGLNGTKTKWIYATLDNITKLFQHNGVWKETVGQFTGLHDKNGVDIYENDRVFDGKYYGIIEYIECSFVISWEIDCSHDDDLNYWNDKIEVIGNIHSKEN